MKTFSTLFWFFSLFLSYSVRVKCLKYNAASLSELALITEEGKQLWESLAEKVKLPRYGSCWKDAISSLRLGCKFLSEDIQSDLALRFTDCFLQMSGYEPMACSFAKDICLRNLSDRAFNAYTEFYTHTQSICYFLQSQVWHEEAQKTIDRLSDMSMLVSAQLQEAGQTQRNILKQQKESMVLQHHLLDNGKSIASALEVSEEKISKIMKDFEASAVEQKKVLFELFEKLTLLRSWIVGEMSWINSLIFYISSLIIGYLFTSTSNTKQARLYILLLLTVNYFSERLIYSHASDELLNEEKIISWIWLSRKFFIISSGIALIYSVFVYCDYNLVNHNLLLEIKNQNQRIINEFKRSSMYTNKNSHGKNVGTEMKMFHDQIRTDISYNSHSVGTTNIPKNLTISPILCHTSKKDNSTDLNKQRCFGQHKTYFDDVDYVSEISEKQESSFSSVARGTPYNLRSGKKTTEKIRFGIGMILVSQKATDILVSA